MKRLGEVVRGVVSPRINEARTSVYPIVHSNFPGNSTDRDVNYQRTGRMEAQKYLRESCYHRIEYSIPNSLAALMGK